MTRETSAPATGESTTQDTWDAVIVGGGAAGLSGALTLARARRRVLVIDAGRPRNAPPPTCTATCPATARPRGPARRGPRRGHRVRRQDHPRHRRVRRGAAGGGFRAAARGRHVRPGSPPARDDGSGRRAARRPGRRRAVGKDVLHCPYCHGWEMRDQAVGILATSPVSFHQAQMWRQWSEDVTLFLHATDEVDESARAGLDARGIRVVEGRVDGLVVGDGALSGVRLASGEVVPCSALVVAPRFTARSAVLESLGIETTQLMFEECPSAPPCRRPRGATSLPGVWVAGNVTDGTAQVVAAAAAGVQAAASINADLIAEEVRLAVARRASRQASRQAPRRKD
ncbi:FAD-binding protein [Oerskovia sp. M15]